MTEIQKQVEQWVGRFINYWYTPRGTTQVKEKMEEELRGLLCRVVEECCTSLDNAKINAFKGEPTNENSLIFTACEVSKQLIRSHFAWLLEADPPKEANP